MSGGAPTRSPENPTRGASTRLTLRLPAAGDWSVLVGGPGAELVWLEEFLCPPLETSGETGRDARVELVVDPDLHAALDGRTGWESAPRRAVFALDAGAVELPVLAGERDAQLARDDHFRAVYRLQDGGTRAEIVSATSDVRLRTALLRVAREQLMGRLFAGGWPLLHASAVELGGRALVFVGPTGAGKTSLLLHALGLPGARLLANDRVAVRAGDDGLRAFAVPTIVTLRESGLRFFPAVADRLAASRFTHRLTLAECAAPDAPAPRAWSNGKFGLTPAQLAELLHRPRSAAAAPAAIVLPRHTGQPGGAVLRRLEIDRARATLREVQLARGAWMVATALFRPPGVDHAAALALRDERLTRLAETVPVVVAELGLDAYRDAELGRRLVALSEATP